MGTTLTGTTPQDTYDSLIKVTDNGPIGATAKYLSDGLGNDSALALSTSRVGIGTTSLQAQLHIDGTTAESSFIMERDTVGANAVIGQIKFTNNNGTTTYGTLLGGRNAAGDGYSALGTGVGTNLYAVEGGNVGIGTNMPAVPLDVVGNIRSSTGILFGSDTAAANLLDDYEEGTWTPSLIFSGGSTGITYTTQAGKYVKIGSKVSVNCYVVLSNKGSSTGSARIDGLPFTVPNAAGNYSPAIVLLDGGITYTGQAQGFANINSTSVALGNVTEAGSATALTDTNFSNSSAIMISLTYLVS